MTKAYSGTDGERGIIVFRETAGQARASVANHLDADFVDVSVKREKWADEYSGKEIPKEEYLKNGWWWECKCFKHQYEETAIVKDNIVYCKECVPK